MSRKILDLLGLSKEDLDRFGANDKRRFRSFLKKGKILQRVNKQKVDTLSRYYNIGFGRTSRELHKEYNAIEDPKEQEAMRSHIIRIEYVFKGGTTNLKKCLYIDAREMIKIIQDMGYVLDNNTKYKKYFGLKSSLQSEAETLDINGNNNDGKGETI